MRTQNNKVVNKIMSKIMSKIKITNITGFVIVELLLYIMFMYLDLAKTEYYHISNNLKFLSIVICSFFSIVYYSKDDNQTDLILLRSALIFTVISDLCILILDYYIVGTLTFCIVQLLYLIRLCRYRYPENLMGNILKKVVRNILITASIISLFIILQIDINLLVIISMIYFVSITLNVGDSISIAYHTKNRSTIIFAIGMVLFILCDINVGVFNLSDFISIESSLFSKVYSFSVIAMWMFYLPAQVCIALSGDTQNSVKK